MMQSKSRLLFFLFHPTRVKQFKNKLKYLGIHLVIHFVKLHIRNPFSKISHFEGGVGDGQEFAILKRKYTHFLCQYFLEFLCVKKVHPFFSSKICQKQLSRQFEDHTQLNVI